MTDEEQPCTCCYDSTGEWDPCELYGRIWDHRKREDHIVAAVQRLEREKREAVLAEELPNSRQAYSEQYAHNEMWEEVWDSCWETLRPFCRARDEVEQIKQVARRELLTEQIQSDAETHNLLLAEYVKLTHDPEFCASVQRGMEEIAAGQTVSLEELRAKYGTGSPRPVEQEIADLCLERNDLRRANDVLRNQVNHFAKQVAELLAEQAAIVPPRNRENAMETPWANVDVVHRPIVAQSTSAVAYHGWLCDHCTRVGHSESGAYFCVVTPCPYYPKQAASARVPSIEDTIAAYFEVEGGKPPILTREMLWRKAVEWREQYAFPSPKQSPSDEETQAG